MLTLQATHLKTGESLRFELVAADYSLGRDPSADLAVPFDQKLSRRHLRLSVVHGQVRVERDGSRHPLFLEGRERQSFTLVPGQRFTSGETLFELLAPESEPALALTQPDIEAANLRNADKVLQVLLGLQPILSGWPDLDWLFEQTLVLLRALLPSANVRLLTGGDPPAAVSRTLVRRCLDQQTPVYHLFEGSPGTLVPTAVPGVSWALAAPVVSSVDRYVLYAVGSEHVAEAPGELDRAALALIARILSQHLEGRHATVLAAQMEAERRAIQAGKLAAVGQLAAGIAHEVNTPLGAVMLALDFGLMQVGQDTPLGARLEAATRELEKAHHIIERLLYYTREGSHRQTLSLARLADDTSAMLGGAVKVTHGRELAVEGNPAELQQLLINLIVNARESSSPEVEVRTEAGTLEVLDRGRGLSPEVASRMFEPFFTTKPVGRGAGLGLSVSRTIAEAHGGTLEGEPRPGGGAVFRLSLPT